MACQKQNWVNNNKTTPLSAERLMHIENGIKAVEDDLNGAVQTEVNGRILGDSILERLITRLEDSTYKIQNLPYVNIGEINLLSVTDIFNLLYWNTNLKERISLFQVDLSYIGINYQKVEAVFDFRNLGSNTWQVTITLQDFDKIIKFVKTTGNMWSRYILTALFKHDIRFTTGNHVCNLIFITPYESIVHDTSDLQSLLSMNRAMFVSGTLDVENTSKLIFGANYIQAESTLYLLVFPKPPVSSYGVFALDVATTTNFNDSVTPYY